MHIFYVPESPDSGTFKLPKAESHHAVRVLRLGVGDLVSVVNGTGTWLQCTLIHPDSNGCEVEILHIHTNHQTLPYYLHMAIAPTKQIDRFEWFLEKATEIGISEITPIWCDRSERRKAQTERSLRVMVAAMKQSLKAWLPVINEGQNVQSFIRNSTTGDRAIAHCQETERYRLSDYWQHSKNMVILIGPEGDFSPEEIHLAIQAGFRPVSLGISRLRTETAGIVACHTAALLNS